MILYIMSTSFETAPLSIDDISNLPCPPRMPSQKTVDLPINPDCSFLQSRTNEFASAYSVVHTEEAWQMLANFNEKSFMFSKDEKILDLMTKIHNAYNCGHSGASLACLMRELEYVAVNGFSKFKDEFMTL